MIQRINLEMINKVTCYVKTVTAIRKSLLYVITNYEEIENARNMLITLFKPLQCK